MSKKNPGEGDRESARRYNEKTQDFVQSGQVDRAARDAAPDDAAQAAEIDRAEAEGRSHAREEDPAVGRDLTRPTKPV